MPQLARSAVALLLGGLAMFLIVAGFELLNSKIFLPPDIDVANTKAVIAAYEQLPVSSQNVAVGVVLFAWALGSFAAAYLTVLIAVEWPYVHGLIAGGLCLLACGAELYSLPHPLWAWIIGLVSPLPLALLAAHRAK